MPTNSFIGIRRPDNKIDGIYCNKDGYIEHNGKILFDHYKNRGKINKLIELGDLSVLGPEIGNKIDFDDSNEHITAVQTQCIAYHRDRNEALHISFDETDENLCKHYMYIYVYELNNEWSVYVNGKNKALTAFFDKTSETTAQNTYLILFSDDTQLKCITTNTRNAIEKAAEHVSTSTQLFCDALDGMKTEKSMIELFNKFHYIDIEHVYIINKEIGVDTKEN